MTFRDLLSDEVHVVETVPLRHSVDALFDSERELVAKAIASRQQEFAAGRWAARSALATLGVHDTEILRTDDRAPIWPSGVVGSITHCKDQCAAAVARSTDLLGLGIDVEMTREKVLDFWETICVEEERDWVRVGGAVSVERVLTVFSGKESFFKAQFPLTGAWLEFSDVVLTFSHPGTFTLRTLSTPSSFLIAGRYSLSTNHVRSAVELRPNPL